MNHKIKHNDTPKILQTELRTEYIVILMKELRMKTKTKIGNFDR